MHEQLEEILGVHFLDPKLLTLALTHRSYIYETSGAGQSSNERSGVPWRFYSGSD